MPATPLIKSQYSDPAIDNHGFVNHIDHDVFDMGVVPGTTVPLIEAYKVLMIQNLKAVAGGGGKPRNLALFRKVLGGDPSAGTWDLLEMWEEMRDYDDASAAGSVSVNPITGTVHVVMSFGKKVGSALQFQSWESTVPRAQFAAPIERIPVGQGPPGPPGSGGIVLLPAVVYAPAWDAHLLRGGENVNIPAVFGVPAASAYLIRLCGKANLADVRIRAGTEASPYFFSLNTQIAYMQIHGQGWAPGPVCYLSATGGEATVWLQIVGYSQ